MSEKLRCYTLFDITSTGIPNRSKPPIDANFKIWLKQRNSQCNFDTILQAISLRSQPEILSLPICNTIHLEQISKFGKNFSNIEKLYSYWTFDFEVQHASVFKTDKQELGALYEDCNGIPMIKCGTEHENLPNFLDISTNEKNIYFEKL